MREYQAFSFLWNFVENINTEQTARIKCITSLTHRIKIRIFGAWKYALYIEYTIHFTYICDLIFSHLLIIYQFSFMQTLHVHDYLNSIKLMTKRIWSETLRDAFAIFLYIYKYETCLDSRYHAEIIVNFPSLWDQDFENMHSFYMVVAIHSFAHHHGKLMRKLCTITIWHRVAVAQLVAPSPSTMLCKVFSSPGLIK